MYSGDVHIIIGVGRAGNGNGRAASRGRKEKKRMIVASEVCNDRGGGDCIRTDYLGKWTVVECDRQALNTVVASTTQTQPSRVWLFRDPNATPTRCQGWRRYRGLVFFRSLIFLPPCFTFPMRMWRARYVIIHNHGMCCMELRKAYMLYAFFICCKL